MNFQAGQKLVFIGPHSDWRHKPKNGILLWIYNNTPWRGLKEKGPKPHQIVLVREVTRDGYLRLAGYPPENVYNKKWFRPEESSFGELVLENIKAQIICEKNEP